MPRAFALTAAHVAQHAGSGGLVALDPRAVGRSHRLYSSRPGPHRNRSARAVLAELRGYQGDAPTVYRADPEPPPQPDVMVVSLRGPITEASEQHEPSGSWTLGHNDIAASLCAAFEIGDVVLCVNSPGGAVAGGPEHMRRAAEAKAKHGRRCIVHSEGVDASMAYWWSCAVGDALYISPDAKAGCVGVRGMLASIAGALAKDGITVEVIEDPEGKAAGVPERPIDPEAVARAQRDVSIAATMFRAAVCDSAIGRASGLTPEMLIEMRGDAYTGADAERVGLVTGVATLEDVLAYALATAGTGARAMEDEKEKDDGRAGEDDPKDKPEGEDENEAQKCSACGAERVGVGGFCAGCGKAFAEEDETTEGEDEPPPSSKPKPDARSAIRPPAARRAASVAAMLGLRADASHPAVMTALAETMRVLDLAAIITGETAPGKILGGLVALAEDVKSAVAVRRDLEAAQREEMLSLAKRAAKIDGSRDGWIVDVVRDDKRVGVKLGPKAKGYTRDELRAYVEGREKNAAPRGGPFAPDPKRAADASNKQRGAVNDKDREMAQQLGRSPEDVARSRSALFGADGAARV